MDAANDISREYLQRTPAATVLYKTIAGHLQTFIALREAENKPLPQYVIKEFESYLECGVVQYGFMRTRCDACGCERIVPFSCRKRGFCPSCGAKRSAEAAVHLVDNILPKARYRQWIVTLPMALRYWVAANRKLLGSVHRIITAEIQRYYVNKGQASGIADGKCGYVSFIQLFGSALQLTPHPHILMLDGVYSRGGDDKLRFHKVGAPTDEEIGEILKRISCRTVRYLRRKDYIEQESTEVVMADLEPVFDEHPSLQMATSASVQFKIAFGPNAGKRVRKIGSSFGYEEEIPVVKDHLITSVNGFTLHCARSIKEHQRGQLEDLITYMGRPSLASDRLVEREDGELEYILKRRFSDGTTRLRLSPLELLEKLTAIIPPPKTHMTRFGGVFASAHPWRSQVILQPGVKKGFEKAIDLDGKRYVQNCNWAKLLSRVFQIEVGNCPECQEPMRIVASVHDRREVKRYLKHVGIDPLPPPIAPAAHSQLELCFDGVDPPIIGE